jgi:hypothetical protein
MAAIIAVVLFGSLLVAFILAGFDGWEHLARERRNRRETQADQIRELPRPHPGAVRPGGRRNRDD